MIDDMPEQQHSTDQPESPDTERELHPLQLTDFLAATAVGHSALVTPVITNEFGNEIGRAVTYVSNVEIKIDAGPLLLYCADCKGGRFFNTKNSVMARPSTLTNGKNTYNAIIEYECRNCNIGRKKYSVEFFFLSLSLAHAKELPKYTMLATKMGAHPEADVPPDESIQALEELLGRRDRDLFRAGWECEKQNRGIGAFAYYRRVVENQKNDLVEGCLKVAKRIGAHEDLVADLEKARGESQFTTALKAVNIPEVLMVKGQNPLKLLHEAVSEGLHTSTDEECLERAGIIRVVLGDLAKNMARALDQRDEVEAAVIRLARLRQEKQQRQSAPPRDGEAG